ncbi:UDP-N-acetylmuramoyl-L-alanyl-D-glutamate--2,6-diaminopimelate ligase [Eubacterium sp.]|uniref:Mur ligase family protein n=1 Tax=Eubacterium sp. TaxID=142586 RepID=UPI00258A5384|nr:UDP-N-acetylmuramoyl-L-alanyl-D-glutamate--2,6-diaminopimelate ligase [Eubacterium sp.]MCR5367931.1 UDP-N-acetylmuramoyl-L-alanyl-D-glutamate--2,6-diaminopimelate ligase [Eubacterium sp.]
MHKLQEYIDVLTKNNLLSSDNTNADDKEIIIKGLTYDSNSVTEGTLFVCKGAAFKQAYLEDAVKKGAVAFISEKEYPDVALPHIMVNDIRRAMPFLGKIFYDSPWNNFKLTGLTGTKGKSTTAYYIKNILDLYEESIGRSETAITSSIDFYDGKKRYESHITTPECLELLYHFDNAAKSDIDFFTMEVSSQALKYNRVDLITYDVGVFLNISEDHISPIEHPDFEDYFSSKLRFFSQVKHALICTDSDYYERIEEASKASSKVTTFGTKPGSDIYGYDIKKVDEEIHFKVKCDRFDKEFILTMPGLFNVQNALAAIAVAVSYDIPEEYIFNGLKTARSKGRMELFTTKDKKVFAIVDYAHNKLSFEKLYESTFSEYPGRRVVTIFGCPGKKALLRREHLGTLAGKNSDMIYLVPEDPGEEPAEEISKDIAQYVEKEGCPYEILDSRSIAIKKAIFEVASPDMPPTVLLITGKGDETRQKIGREYIPCPSDAEYVQNFIKEYDEKYN